jgi:hypothetical protein
MHARPREQPTGDPAIALLARQAAQVISRNVLSNRQPGTYGSPRRITAQRSESSSGQVSQSERVKRSQVDITGYALAAAARGSAKWPETFKFCIFGSADQERKKGCRRPGILAERTGLERSVRVLHALAGQVLRMFVVDSVVTGRDPPSPERA